MATIPLSGTDIRLLSDVPFSNDYKHTRWFGTQAAQTDYFMNKPLTHSMSQANFQRIEGQSFIRADKSIDDLWHTNYLMFQNNGKWFYGFVTRLEYVQSNRTNVHFQIDVFQTWSFRMNFKPSYVNREHRQLWNADGTPYINTVDEGLNYGTEYDVVATTPVQPSGAYKWLVIVSKTPIETDNNEIQSSIVATPQPLNYYAIPYRDDDSVPTIYLAKQQISLIATGKPSKILEVLYNSISTVNDIVSIYVTDYIGVEHSWDGQQITFPNNSNDVSYSLIEQISTGEVFTLLHFRHVSHFVPQYIEAFPDKYSGFNSVRESKLLMYPYTSLVLMDFKGNMSEFKLEYIQNNNVRVAYKGSLGTSNHTSVGITDYNRSIGDGQSELTSNETALINSNPNDVPILNDHLASYLQGNKNSLQNQRSTIEFNGVMNAIGGAVGTASSAMQGNTAGALSGATGTVQGLGNTQLQLEGINAKIRDIGNTPPNISKMGSNTAYNFGNGYDGVFLMKKQIKLEYRRKLQDYFNMFGYKVNEVKIPNFHTRKYWNYVQTTSCVITGSFNHEDLTELKAIFDNGITFWHTDDIGNYDLENEVI